MLVAERSYDDGSNNRGVSFDGVYKPLGEMRFRAQATASQTHDVLAGGRSSAQVMLADGFHDNGKEHLFVRLGAVSPKFRADNSIIAQNGYRVIDIESWQCRKFDGFFNQACPGVNVKEQRAWDNTPLNRFVTPVVALNGNRKSYLSLQPRWLNYTRTRAVSLVYAHQRGFGRELNVGVTHGNALAGLQPNRTTTALFAQLSWALSL